MTCLWWRDDMMMKKVGRRSAGGATVFMLLKLLRPWPFLRRRSRLSSGTGEYAEVIAIADPPAE
jgi:hypothetical protein